jgi:hypothetical protein
VPQALAPEINGASLLGCSACTRRKTSTVLLEMGLGGKLEAKSKRLGRKPNFP